MCGRYESWVDDDDLVTILELEKRGSAEKYLKQAEVFPGTVQPVFYGSRVKMRAHLSSWGMPAPLPGMGAGGDKTGSERDSETVSLAGAFAGSGGSPKRPGGQSRSRMLINARAETAAEKPRFAEAFRSGQGVLRRCVAVASGYFEWFDGVKYRIADGDGDLLFLAAIEEDDGERSRAEGDLSTVPVFSTSTMPLAAREGGGSAEPTQSAVRPIDPGRRHVILTCPASCGIERIHDRMPLLLRREECLPWLYDDEFAKRRLSRRWGREMAIGKAAAGEE